MDRTAYCRSACESGRTRRPSSLSRQAPPVVALSRSFNSILIANRGEIAVRIARTCRDMGIRSIAVYSDADRGALHVRACDDAISIGGVSPRDSYLRSDLIIAAALRSKADGIHPGYGFLSENADFAQACAEARITFVGPRPNAMRAVGDKIAAKQTALACGVPVLPGYLERTQSIELLEASAREIGVPLLIKAAAGGGGRGMRLVEDLSDLDAALESARREAQAAFGDPTVFLERYIESPRHIEVQIVADDHGTCVALGERECSIQRRYQKILEESPSPAVDAGLRRDLEDAAIKIARAVGYTNAGTVEFMLDRDGRYYFLEMNARLQVEHPVTEMVTGLDLVRAQLEVAAGRRLMLDAQRPGGHAIEVRVYAEDPGHGFLPSTGTITTFRPNRSAGVRNDVAVERGSVVSAAYDPMLAKLIVHASNREDCVEKLALALDDYLIGGVITNLAFLRWLVQQPAFKNGATSTDFIDRNFRPELLGSAGEDDVAMIAAVGALQDLPREDTAARLDPWQRLGAWRHAATPREVRFNVPAAQASARWDFDNGGWRCSVGKSEATVVSCGEGAFVIRWNDAKSKFAAWGTGGSVAVSLRGLVSKFALAAPPTDAVEAGHRHGGESVKGSIEAPMSGTIVKVQVKPGEMVKALGVLLVMEAMKMEHAIVAPYPGKITAVNVTAGQAVMAGDNLVELAED